MSREATQRFESFSLDVGERRRRYLHDLAAFSPGGERPDDSGDGLRLSGLGELLQVRKLYPLPAQLDRVEPPAPRGLALAAPQVYGGRIYAAAPGGCISLPSVSGARGGNFSLTIRASPVASRGS